jgi:SAM-dependent methyltransferase
MQTFHRVDACRICGNKELVPVLHLGEQFLTGVFPRSKTERLTRGPLELVKCTGGNETCGLVQLQHSFASDEMYGDRYGYRSSLNSAMVAHLQETSATVRAKVALGPSDLVLDIGSNDGTLLSFFPETSTRVGIDPAARRFRDRYAPGVHAISDFFTAARFDDEFGGQKAQIVTSIAMFYDLDDPQAFVCEVASVLADDGIWYFEQSYMPSMLAATAYDTVCHEHVEYYALAQIEWLLKRAGLRLIDVRLNEVNGGSFAVTACKSASSHLPDSDAIERVRAIEAEGRFNSDAPFVEFAHRVSQHRAQLVHLIDELNSEGKRVIGYGASTKGNVIMQYCNITPDQIPCMAEVNPDKFGCLTPGTWIPIVSEVTAKGMNPDYLLAMPWHFRSNLVAREAAYIEAGGSMIFPLPQISIVGRQPS